MMEHLNFTGRASQEELGRGLAKMHLAAPTVSPIPVRSSDVTCPGNRPALPRLCVACLRAQALHYVQLLLCCCALALRNRAQSSCRSWATEQY